MQPSDARHANPQLQAKLQGLYGRRGTPVIDLTIRADFYELLRRLGNPHRALPPIIHVAGTNGKGSTIAFMRAMLEAAGKTVHIYTSPHLVRFNERIVLAGREIGDDALEALLDEVIAANNDPGGDLGNTFFELKTVMAFAAFSRVPADVLLLEVGMGGRLDATNVVDRPAVTVITPIGLDHQEFLGHTVEAIAGEKAGIMKPGVPCVVAAQDEVAVDEMFMKRAAALGAPLFRAGQEWDAAATPDGMRFRFGDRAYDLPPPVLVGAHQICNAGAALAALHCLPAFSPTAEILAAGLRAASWPGRLQRLPDPAPGWELWLDGAHNAHGARALARQLAAWQAEDGQDIHLVFGMLKRKDIIGFLTPLVPLLASMTSIPIKGELDSHTSTSLDLVLKNSHIPQPIFAPDLTNALNKLTKNAFPARIVIAGSLYLAAQILA